MAKNNSNESGVIRDIVKRCGEQYGTDRYFIVPDSLSKDLFTLGYNRTQKDVLLFLLHERRPGENGQLMTVVFPSLKRIGENTNLDPSNLSGDDGILKSIEGKKGIRIKHGKRGSGEPNEYNLEPLLIQLAQLHGVEPPTFSPSFYKRPDFDEAWEMFPKRRNTLDGQTEGKRSFKWHVKTPAQYSDLCKAIQEYHKYLDREGARKAWSPDERKRFTMAMGTFLQKWKDGKLSSDPVAGRQRNSLWMH